MIKEDKVKNFNFLLLVQGFLSVNVRLLSFLDYTFFLGTEMDFDSPSASCFFSFSILTNSGNVSPKFIKVLKASIRITLNS